MEHLPKPELPTAPRYLIVNADDFGLTKGVNQGIVEAHRRGIVTSTSLMVRAAAASEAAEHARANPRLSVGLHFDVGEWRYLGGEWKAAYQVVDPADGDALRTEFESQLATFERLLGRLPSHLDSHQHIHLNEPARCQLLHCAAQLNLPLRSCTSVITYQGNFYGQTGEGEPFPAGISVRALVETIRSLPQGWTEIGCHPGYSLGLDSIYLREREEEIRVLCCAELRNALSDSVKLCSFHDLREGLAAFDDPE